MTGVQTCALPISGLAADAEITLEANPGTVTEERLRIVLNRASEFGVLSTAQIERVLGPEHASEGAELFRLELTEVVVVRLGEPADHLVLETWHEGRGTRTTVRR